MPDLYDVVQFLLDNGADPSVTGTVHLNMWRWFNDNDYLPRRKIISNIDLSRGGFGAGDDISPLIAAAAYVFCVNETPFKNTFALTLMILSASFLRKNCVILS